MSDRGQLRHSVWAFLRVMNVRLRFVFLMVLTGLIAANWEDIANHWERWTRPRQASVAGENAAYEFYCPMHPSVVRGEPGNCPICGMPLTKRAKGESPELPEGTLARVQLSPHRMELGGIATSEVAYQPLAREIRVVGTIEIDERKIAHIAARTAGRVEKLHVSFTGQKVGKGDPLADIYSPELVSTQEEYLIALRAAEKLQGGADAQSILEASRERLRLWGIDDEQIAALESAGAASERLTLHSPISGTVTSLGVQAGQYVAEGSEMYTIADLSTVWVVGSVLEDDAANVHVGQTVEIATATDPTDAHHGKVAFVQPVVEQATRTVRIRVDVPNPDGLLKPGMYVEMRVKDEGGAAGTERAADMAGAMRGGMAGGSSAGVGAADAAAATYTCPMDPEVVSDRPGKCPKCGMDLVKVERAPAGLALSVPESAVIDTGTRKIVYLEREPGIFDAVEVQLGARAGAFYPVIMGLSAGDRIVTAGAFLVDAEGRLNPAASSAYFGASGMPSMGKP